MHLEKLKQFDLKKEYLRSLKYLKSSQNFIYLIIGIFVFFSLVGFFIPAPENLASQIHLLIKELLESTQGMSQFELIQFIFLNNLKSSFFGMVFGIFFGIFSFFVAISNGYLLGFVALESVKLDGVFVLWRLLPHGIFELPAIFISLGLGVKIGSSLFEKRKRKLTKEYFFESLRTFILIVIPLLLIAGIIEGTLIFLAS